MAATAKEGWLTRFTMLQDRRLRFRSGVFRLAWLAAVLGLLACPIVYRGGAEWPHGHSIFQLLYDAAHGSIDHHHAAAGSPSADDDPGETLPAPHEPTTAPAEARLSPMGESVEGLAVALVILALWASGRRERGPAALAEALGDGERPAPDPPPPRRALVFA